MFINYNRNRYYGLRVHDIVKCIFSGLEGEVVRLAFMDNNSVYIQDKTGKITPVVAEWQEIITLMDDRVDLW